MLGAPSARSITSIASAFVLCGALQACRSRAAERAFLATRIPVARLDSVLHAADSVRLPLAAARTLFDVTAESGYAAAMPHDTMTVADIVAWGRAEHARKQAADAAASAAAQVRRAERKQQLDSLVAVSLVNKSFLAKDPDVERYEDYISLSFAYHNKSARALRAFQATSRSSIPSATRFTVPT